MIRKGLRVERCFYSSLLKISELDRVCSKFQKLSSSKILKYIDH
ncbi:hypothetical protein ACQV5M_04710 [Leptospira sp. SA-E8]